MGQSGPQLQLHPPGWGSGSRPVRSAREGGTELLRLPVDGRGSSVTGTPWAGVAHDPLSLDDAADLLGRQRLVFEKPLCQCVQLVKAS